MEKSTTVTGQSIVTVDDKPVTVAFMNATIQANGTVSIGHIINDKHAFDTNTEQVQKDFAEFDAYVYSL